MNNASEEELADMVQTLADLPPVPMQGIPWDANWGWALWNFRGSFGILDSGREDIRYEDWHGHKLDRQLLELLRKH